LDQHDGQDDTLKEQNALKRGAHHQHLVGNAILLVARQGSHAAEPRDAQRVGEEGKNATAPLFGASIGPYSNQQRDAAHQQEGSGNG